MKVSLIFFVNSFLLGVGLAMDAFSVSIADALNEPAMSRGRMLQIAGTFGLFQFMMPMIGWLCVTFIVDTFRAFQPFIPWIALCLLVYIGAKMIKDGLTDKAEEASHQQELTFGGRMLQALATSIDALSVGFTIASYGVLEALLSSFIVGAVTTVICLGGLTIGKAAGSRLTSRASILGGLILIGIGMEIVVGSFI